MTAKWMTWVLDESPTQHAARLVQLSLANYASEEGFCLVGASAIARETRMTSVEVERALVWLEQDGWVATFMDDGKTIYQLTTRQFSFD